MIQIIGLLGCFMLGMKLFEMQFNPALRDEDKGPGLDQISIVIAIGWIGVVGFAVWLLAAGQQIERSFEDLSSQSEFSEPDLKRISDTIDCVEAAGPTNYEAQLACYDD